MSSKFTRRYDRVMTQVILLAVGVDGGGRRGGGGRLPHTKAHTNAIWSNMPFLPQSSAYLPSELRPSSRL